VTTLVEADPDHKLQLPKPGPWPLFVALSSAVAFVGGMFSMWFICAGAALAGLCLMGWGRPRPPREPHAFRGSSA
jgi:hypothetical protein